MTDEQLLQWLRDESNQALAVVEYHRGKCDDRFRSEYWRYRGYYSGLQAVLWKIESEKLIEERNHEPA